MMTTCVGWALSRAEVFGGGIVRYMLVSYGKGSDVPRSEVDVSQVGLDRLSALFRIEEPEFVDVYPVNRVQAEQLAGWIDHALDTESYDYHLEVGREPGA